jgi:hypothetical protein
MPNKKKAAKTINQAKADIANVLKAQKKLELELHKVKKAIAQIPYIWYNK